MNRPNRTLYLPAVLAVAALVATSCGRADGRPSFRGRQEAVEKAAHQPGAGGEILEQRRTAFPFNLVKIGLGHRAPRVKTAAAASEERVGPICAVNVSGVQLNVCAGTGFGAYAELAASFREFPTHSHTLPRATDIALLGEAAFLNGEGLPAQQAQPVYLRDNVAIAKKS